MTRLRPSAVIEIYDTSVWTAGNSQDLICSGKGFGIELRSSVSEAVVRSRKSVLSKEASIFSFSMKALALSSRKVTGRDGMDDWERGGRFERLDVHTGQPYDFHKAALGDSLFVATGAGSDHDPG